jgi:hypothetical protein
MRIRRFVNILLIILVAIIIIWTSSSVVGALHHEVGFPSDYPNPGVAKGLMRIDWQWGAYSHTMGGTDGTVQHYYLSAITHVGMVMALVPPTKRSQIGHTTRQ